MRSDYFDEPLRRRELLRGGAGLALALGLAGCGVGDEPASEQEGRDAAKVVKAQPDGDLVYFNWSEYLDPKLIKEFEKRYGVKVRESNFDSMNGMMAKLRSGNRYDVIFPTADWAQRLRKGNQLLRIDKEQLKNADTVYDYFAKPWYDPGADHTVPYALYASGIIYRNDKVEMTGSWNDLGARRGAGQDLPARRLPGGPRRGQPGHRRRAQLQGRGRGREVQAVGARPQAEAARLLDRRHPEHGRRQRLDPPRLERRRRQRPQPGQEARELLVPEVQGGHPARHRLLRDPGQRRAPGHGARRSSTSSSSPRTPSRNIEYMGYPMPYKGPDETFAELVKDDPRSTSRSRTSRTASSSATSAPTGAGCGTRPGRRSRPA